MSEHIASKKIYYIVFGSLLILTLLTWQIAYIDLGPWNTVVALLIAIFKAGLVATFFMHLRWSASVMRLVLFAALFWLAILLTLTVGDVLTRNTVARPEPWQTSITISHPVAVASRK